MRVQVPERWLHGWFDYAGGSHNIWHLAVLGGILFHYLAMQSFFSVAFERGQRECGYGHLMRCCVAGNDHQLKS